MTPEQAARKYATETISKGIKVGWGDLLVFGVPVPLAEHIVSDVQQAAQAPAQPPQSQPQLEPEKLDKAKPQGQIPMADLTAQIVERFNKYVEQGVDRKESIKKIASENKVSYDEVRNILIQVLDNDESDAEPKTTTGYGEDEYDKYDEEPQFGDFNGLLINVMSNDGPTSIDRNGIDIYTGKKYRLDKELIQKFAELDATTKHKQFGDKISHARYDYKGTHAIRSWDYDGLIARGTYCLWLGARKAEKSLFALRKAMHDACGKNWLNHKNLVGPVKVLYFDTENDKADVDERYREIITEFTPSEQKLIQKNLAIEIGKEMKRVRVSIEFNNTELWEYLKKSSEGVRVVYLDCWYQLQSIKASDNETQKRVLELFEDYFPNTTLFLLHHTGRESQESLLRKSPAWLRVIGAERWSSKSSGGNVLTKKAELIICQEKYVERDEEGIEGDWFIDFQAYSRSSPGSILFSFEPVFGATIEGVDHEYKYRRKMVVKLSTLAAKAAQKLRGKGPWSSKYALAKDVNMVGGKQYRAVDELIVKGFIVQEGKDFYVNEEGYDEAIELSAENAVAVKTAGTFLDGLLLRQNGLPNAGAPYEFIKAKAEAEGFSMSSIRRARTRRKITTVEKPDGPWWVMDGKKSAAHDGTAVQMT